MDQPNVRHPNMYHCREEQCQMEQIPLCNKHIMLSESADFRVYQTQAQYCQSAVAGSLEACAAVAEAVREHMPVGAVLRSLSGPQTPSASDAHPTETLIERYKEQLRPEVPSQADFLYLRSSESFASLRCQVLAVTDVCGRSLIAELTVGQDGLLPFGTEVTAAIAVLQRIGVSTVILQGETADVIEQALLQAAPYARISLGARVEPQWITEQRHFPNAELFVPSHAEDAKQLWQTLQHWQGARLYPRDHSEFLAASDGTCLHFVEPTIDILDEIEMDSHFSERLLEAEDDAGAIKLHLETEEDLMRFEEQVFMLSRPVCLWAEQPEILERALRIYPGLALYDGTWELEPRLIKYFSQKYGMICL